MAETGRVRPLRRGVRDAQEILQQLLPVRGTDGFRVVLHAVDRVAAVLHGHDLAILRPVRAPRGDHEVLGERPGLDHQRVVPHAGHGTGDSLEQLVFFMITSHVFPCMSRSARTTRAPNASPIAWWPRHTPRTGTFPASAFTSGTRIPASPGVHGPGESTAAVGLSASTCSTVSASLRYTTGSAPSSPNNWTRLYVNES